MADDESNSHTVKFALTMCDLLIDLSIDLLIGRLMSRLAYRLFGLSHARLILSVRLKPRSTCPLLAKGRMSKRATDRIVLKCETYGRARKLATVAIATA